MFKLPCHRNTTAKYVNFNMSYTTIHIICTCLVIWVLRWLHGCESIVITIKIIELSRTMLLTYHIIFQFLCLIFNIDRSVILFYPSANLLGPLKLIIESYINSSACPYYLTRCMVKSYVHSFTLKQKTPR